MHHLLTKAMTTVAKAVATVTSVSDAKDKHEQVKKSDQTESGVEIRKVDLSDAVDDVRDLEYTFVDKTK
jgi:hypothetical protein